MLKRLIIRRILFLAHFFKRWILDLHILFFLLASCLLLSDETSHLLNLLLDQTLNTFDSDHRFTLSLHLFLDDPL